MNLFRWFLFNALFIAFLVLGTVYESVGAENVVMIWAWFSILITLTMLSKECRKIFIDQVKKDGGLSAPMWANWLIDIPCVILMSWYGWMWTASFYLFHTLMQATVHAEYKKSLEEEK